MNVAGWRLYYADGSVLDSNQTDWDSAPPNGVQVLVVFYDEKDLRGLPYRALYHGSPGNAGDYYWQFGAGSAKDVPKGANVKYGQLIEQRNWRTIYNAALSDYRWP